jgi:hypothetical protein
MALLQVGPVLAAFYTLPIRLPEMLSSPLKKSSVLWQRMLLILGAGLPFLVLSTSSSILQTWHARTSRAAAKDPYSLYSASNGGSMLCLFSYPALLEPLLGLIEQSRLWEWDTGS